MPEMPDTDKDLQEAMQAIKDTTDLLIENKSLERGDLDVEKEGKIFTDHVRMRNGEMVTPAEHPGQRFMMGSVTKLFIFRAIAKELESQGIFATDPIFPLNTGLIREVIQRGHLGYILSHPEIYQPVIDWFNQFGLAEDIVQDLQSADIRVKEVAIAKMNEQKFNWNSVPFPDFSVDFVELCHWALQVSADSPLAVARNYYYGNLKHTYTDLQTAVVEQVPSLEMTESTVKYRHWVQPGPNTVELTYLTEAMDEFVAEEVNDSFKEAIHAAVTNNPINFGFSLSGSKKAEEWQTQGYTIVEKTGFYPTVIWIRDLAKQGYPAHMAISSIVSVIAPDGQRFTVGLQMSVEIALPDENTKEGYPDESSDAYQTYIEGMKTKYFDVFYRKLVELIAELM